MNKSKYILLAALLLASCTQDELPQDTPDSGFSGVITFNSPYTATRSDALRSGDFVEGDQVGVLGFCKASNTVNGELMDYSTSPWDTKKMFAKPDVFYNQMLEYQGDGSWTYTWSGTFDNQGPVGGDTEGGLHPWSTNPDDTFSFFAYYPYAEMTKTEETEDEEGVEHTWKSGTITKTIDGEEVEMGTITLSGDSETGDPTITYTMPHSTSGNNTSGRNWEYVPDFMLAYVTDHLKSEGSVKLKFRHIFSAFEFQINNYNEFPIRVSDLYIRGGADDESTGFYRSVTVVGQQNDYTVGSDIYVGEFQLIEGATDDGIECAAATYNDNGELVPATMPVTVDHTENGSPISLLFIPDENGKITSDGNKSLYIELRVSSSSEVGVDFERVAPMNLENSTFQPGVRSIFSINVIGNDIYLQMRSDGTWDDGGDSDITFE